MTNKHARAVTLCCALSVAATACERSSVRELAAAPPLNHVSIRSSTPPLAVLSWSQDISITLAPDADVPKLVDTRIFLGLQPGMTIEQATSKLGPPARAWSDDSGNWSEYRNQWGTVQLGCERPRSVSASDASCNWRLYAHPTGALPTVFGPAVIEQIETAKKMTPRANQRSVTLWRWDHTALVDAILVGERITQMQLHAHIASH